MIIAPKKKLTKTTKWILAASTGVIFVAFGVYAFTSINRSEPTTSDSSLSESALRAQQEADNDRKQQLIENSNTDTTPPSEEEIISNISLSSQNNSDGTVSIITKLSSIPSGTCTLTAKMGETTITKSAAVLYQPEYSTCAGFNLTRSEISSGTWTISLSIKNGDSEYNKEMSLLVD